MKNKRKPISPSPTENVACSDCGEVAHGRQYARAQDRYLCERCFLKVRKNLVGSENVPYEMFVESLAEVLDLRERETWLHSKRVAANTLVLARHFYSETSDLREVYWGSLLHDIGKIGVPDTVLLKPGKLTAEEWHIMRQHPRNGHAILQNHAYLSMAADIVLCHEERYDGSGYPAGLKGDEIPLPARLFAIIDTLDAITFDRPYRTAMPFDAAKAEILRVAGSQFDPQAVEIFLQEEGMLREMVALQLKAQHSAQYSNY